MEAAVLHVGASPAGPVLPVGAGVGGGGVRGTTAAARAVGGVGICVRQMVLRHEK